MGAGGPLTAVWSSAAGWPPPVLRTNQGEEFRAHITNQLDREISLHWHGVRAASEMMSLKVAPGEQNALECVFTPPDAGTFWFGPVADVSRLREMGLYGLFVVFEASLAETFEDIPLILDDWLLSDDGVIEESSFGDLDRAIGEGRLGNWFTVNGAFRPDLPIPRGKLSRLRLLNAANVRTMRVLFKGSDPFVAALDGQPVPLRNLGAAPLVLAPGQRCDLLVTEGRDDITIALDLFEDVVEIGYLQRTGPEGHVALPDNFILPTNPISTWLAPENAIQASLIIEGGAKGGLKSARFKGTEMDTRTLLENGMAWSFNGVAGLADEPWGQFPRGATVFVNFDNRTKFDQPLHLHGHVWRLVESGGKSLVEEPWRDTAVIGAGKTAKLAFIADNPGRWGLHSTIAERVDAGLITSFVVDS
jgi:FtsP/CotA-like multicopper oxidase with cupredoxin domain